MTNTQQVLEKVRKIIAIGRDSAASEHERDTAMKMAHRLLAKHNLVMADAESHSHSQVEGRVTEQFDYYNYPWVNYILDSVADLFYCVHIRYKLSDKKAIHKFLGTEANAKTSAEMCEYVVRSVAKQAARQYGSATNSDGRAFCYGAMMAIHDRCKAIKAQEAEIVKEDSELSSCTALMVVSMREQHKAANNAEIAKMGCKERKTGRVKAVDADAYSDGHEYGSNIQLNKQVQ